MLKPLTTTYKDREVTLECTHKRTFPPPQMYGSTPDDIDTLWKQGTIDQNQYQHLKVWHEKCGQMVMGPRCLDCPLALKQNPRPGRPNVIETENWLEAKNKMHWDDMKAGKLEGVDGEGAQMELGVDEPDEEEDAPTEVRHAPPLRREIAEDMIDNGILDSEPETPPSTEPTVKPLAAEADDEETSITDILSGADDDAEEGDEESAIDEDIISALADD